MCALLFPSAAGLTVDRVEHGDDGIVVHARGTTAAVSCPDCSTSSTRVHGAYQRRIVDHSVGGRRLSVRLTVRRFRCVTPACVRRTFVEQVEGLSTRYARASPGLAALWRSVAVELGGRPAQRLCRVLAMPVGRTHLLGLIGNPPSPQRAPRILGVDEFADSPSHTGQVCATKSRHCAPLAARLSGLYLRHEGKRVPVRVVEERHPLLEAVLVLVDEVGGSAELHAAR